MKGRPLRSMTLADWGEAEERRYTRESRRFADAPDERLPVDCGHRCCHSRDEDHNHTDRPTRCCT